MTEQPAPDVVSITIDGVGHQVPAGSLLIKAAQDSGTYIPRFCWHERMNPVGMCRMCLVEVQGPRGPMLVTACTNNVADGMVVDTQERHGEEGPGGCPRVPPGQPPPRLPGVRQGW